MPYGILPVGRGRFKGLDWDILVEATRRTGVNFDLHMSKSYASMIKDVLNSTMSREYILNCLVTILNFIMVYFI